jgi:hypothetical protein
MLAAATVIEAALVAISLAIVVSIGGDRSTGGTAHYALIALLALAMGCRTRPSPGGWVWPI